MQSGEGWGVQTWGGFERDLLGPILLSDLRWEQSRTEAKEMNHQDAH